MAALMLAGAVAAKTADLLRPISAAPGWQAAAIAQSRQADVAP